MREECQIVRQRKLECVYISTVEKKSVSIIVGNETNSAEVAEENF